jgi:uncharacterized membrane protein (TIGR02234 family)
VTPRRELLAALGGCLVGAAAVLLAAGRTWVRVEAGAGALVPGADVALTGRALRPAVPALGLVALAATAAVVATRGPFRVVVGALLVVSGAVVVLLAAQVTADPAGVAAATAAVRRSGASGSTTATAWPVVAAFAGGWLAAQGLAVAIRGRRWPSMSARYDAPRAERRRELAPEAAMWEALDRGDDPT